MRIGFDAKRAVQNFTGLGNYSRFILDILSRNGQDKCVLYAPKHRDNKELDPILERKNVSILYPHTFLSRKLSALWRIWSISKDLCQSNLDLFVGLSNELPLNIHRSGVKSLLVVHDLIFLRYPQYYAAIDRNLYIYKYRESCRHADHIVAVSEQTKRDLISFWGIDEQKISVVYQGCNPMFGQPVDEARFAQLREKYQLPERFVLNVGSIEDRKNLLLIVQALEQLPEEITLVAIGKNTPYAEKVKKYIQTHHLEHRVRILHKVPHEELPVFYRMAGVFVYPSRFEGFGIPILEAIRSHVPVIAATGSCLEEAGGPDSLYVDPDDATTLAQYIRRIWNDADLSARMVEKSLKYAERFEKDAIEREMRKVITSTSRR
jgi:glycosyltransferase involved in cell wall biosynthesis